MKRILAIYYSQTGQLKHLLDSVLEPIDKEQFDITLLELMPERPFPFPWPFWDFLDAFPESVSMQPAPIQKIEWVPEEPFDLVILAYQVWYLSPSQPVTAFLQSEWAHQYLKNSPVITLIGCRNMWVLAQEEVKKQLSRIGARLIDNVALVDQGGNFETFYTAPRWLMSGQKHFKYFTSAGISEQDIKEASRFGRVISSALNALNAGETLSSPILKGLGAVKVDMNLVASEKVGRRAFLLWSKLIRASGKPGQYRRRPLLGLWFAVLILGIMTVVPLRFVIGCVLARFKSRAQKLDVLRKEYEAPSGSEEFLMARRSASVGE